MSEVLALGRIPLDDYAELLGAGEIEELRALATPLLGRSIQMVNSTAVGGGVAAILTRLVPLAEELDLNIKWEVMSGGEDFFEVTKAFHNALHGAPYHASQRDFDIFLAYNEKNRQRLPLDAEFVVIHDPQPAALIEARKPGANHWVWRCHIDLSHPNRTVWDFLEQFVSKYDGAMFSSPEFSREGDGDPDIKVLELPAWAPLEVNALQRASTVVLQKSLREGFGLTVSEALWKKKPVVASAVGGIPIQIIHKHTGLLSHSVEGTAYQIRFLLSHPEIAVKLGEHGHEHVKENYLITHNLKRDLTLLLTLTRGS